MWVVCEVCVDVVIEVEVVVCLCIYDDVEIMFEVLLEILGEVEDISFVVLEDQIVCLCVSCDVLGVVNLCVDEDKQELEIECDCLVVEKDDLIEVICKLCQGIGSLNCEGCECLLVVFDMVNVNFIMLFMYLFGGGEVCFVLVEFDDFLDVGLEIMCQLLGKKLLMFSLLLGGEQMLMVMVLIFVVFLVNFVLICVLDEVDVLLDDVNVICFCDLMDEMICRIDMCFLVIIYYVVIMVWMDWLFGVMMVE